MIGSSEVFITYKRKRPLSQLKPTHELKGNNNSSLEPQKSICSTRFTQKDEPGNLLEKQKEQDLKHSPGGKQLHSPCSEPQNSGKPVHQQIQDPDKARDINCLEICEMEPITLHSHKVLLKLNPSESASSDGKDSSLQVEASLGKKSESTQDYFFSNLSLDSTCNTKRVEGSLGSQLEDTTKTSRPTRADSFIENKCEIVCIPYVSFSGDSPEANDLSFKVKSSMTCTNSHPKKFSNPVITYSRRAKKKCVDGTATQKKLVDENRPSVVGCGNSASNGSSLYQGPFKRCGSVNQTMAMVLDMDQLLVHRQDGEEEIACKEDHALHSTLSGSASETKINGRDADHEQDTWWNISVGSSVAEGVQELDSLLHLPSSHPKPDDPVQEDHCHSQFMEISPADRSNEAKQSTSPKSGASIGEEFRVTSYGPTKKSEGISKPDDILEGGTLAQLELSVAPPCSLSPSKQASKQKMHKDPGNPSNPTHLIVLHEGTVEIPDEAVQELDCHSTPNDENPCSSTTEDGINCEQACDGKVSSALSMNVSRQAPCQQCVSVDILDEAVPLACISQGTSPCMDFPGRAFLPQSGSKETACEQSPTKTSLCPPHFLGLSLPMNKNSGADTVKDFPSTSMSSSIFENRSSIHHWTPGWQDMLSPSASNKNLLVDRHRQLIDNIVTKEGFLKGRSGSSLEFKGSINQWSEEELDFLWIGVRRHGRGNWEAMLRDPKLHFSEWRIAEDLAEQWHVEQSKLLNVTQFQPVRSSKADIFPTISGGFLEAGTRSRYCSYGAEHNVPKFPAPRTATELSLGDAYVPREEGIQKRYPFHLSGPASTLPVSKNDNSNFPVAITNSVLQNMGSKQKTVKGQRSRRYSDRKQAKYDMGYSALQRKLDDISVSNLPGTGEMSGHGKNKGTLNEDLPAGSHNQRNLPHWLREVFSMPQRSTGPVVPSSVPAIAHSVSLLYNDKPIILPFSDPCIMSPPPKDLQQMPKNSRTNNKIANLRASDISASVPCHPASSTNVSWMETKLGLDLSTLMPATDNRVSDQKNVDNLNKACSAPSRPNNLIVIDSDASSEETISDDRSGRH